MEYDVIRSVDWETLIPGILIPLVLVVALIIGARKYYQHIKKKG